MKKNLLLFLFIALFCCVGFSQDIERFADKDAAFKAGYTLQRRECAPGEKEVKGAYGTAPHDMLVFKYVKENEEVATPIDQPEEDVAAVEAPATEVVAQDFGDTAARNLPAPVLDEASQNNGNVQTIAIYVVLVILLVLVLLSLFWVWRLYHMYRDKVTELENELYRMQKNPTKVDVAPQVKSEVERYMMSHDFERMVSTLVRHALESGMGHRVRTTPQQEAVIDQLMREGSALPSQMSPPIQPQFQPSFTQPVPPSQQSSVAHPSEPSAVPESDEM